MIESSVIVNKLIRNKENTEPVTVAEMSTRLNFPIKSDFLD